MTAVLTAAVADMVGTPPILVHSHRRWDEGWQRSRPALSWLARSRDILFVEAPQFLDDISRATLYSCAPHDAVQRVVPQLPAPYRANNEATHRAVRSLLLAHLTPTGNHVAGFDRPILWLESAAAAPVWLGAFNECAVVYDALDDHAPAPRLVAGVESHVQFLWRRADLVLTTREARTPLIAEPTNRLVYLDPANPASWARTCKELTQRLHDIVEARREVNARPF